MKKIFFILATTALVAFSAAAQTAWVLDNTHSNVKFSVSHLVISDVEGSFKAYSGSLKSPDQDFSDASVEFAIDVASVSTDNDMRDKHLKSDDFFNAEKYPKMTFKSTSWKKIDDKQFVLEGDLTIRDVTRKVTFTVTGGGTIQDPWGNTKAGFKATSTINRFDFGLKFNALTDAGNAVVGKMVSIVLNLEFAKQKAS